MCGQACCAILTQMTVHQYHASTVERVSTRLVPTDVAASRVTRARTAKQPVSNSIIIIRCSITFNP